MWDLFRARGLLPRVSHAAGPAASGPLPPVLYSRLHTQSPLHPTTSSSAARNPGPCSRAAAHAPRPELQPSARLTARPHSTDLWVARHPQSVHTTCPLPSMPSPPPPPSSKTLSHSSRPVRMSPPPGSLLGSQHAMGASDFLSSRLGLSGRGHPCLASRSFPPPPLALPPSPCSNGDLPPSPPRCVFWLLFSRLCRLSLGSNLCSPWSFLWSILLP